MSFFEGISELISTLWEDTKNAFCLLLHTYDIYIQRDIVRQTDGMTVGG